jgi:hypothetical protein
MENQEEKFGSLNGVVITKANLLETLKTNKEKHDSLYNEACEAYKEVMQGYSVQCSEYFVKLAEEYSKHAKVPTEAYDQWDKNSPFSFPAFKSPADLVYPTQISSPVSYSDQYVAAIRRIEMSVYDKFSLNEQEFQSFVLNNWSWKTSFLANTQSLYFHNTGALVLSGYYAGKARGVAMQEF